eukprot:2642339-Karenia_brevis.AAC.1
MALRLMMTDTSDANAGSNDVQHVGGRRFSAQSDPLGEPNHPRHAGEPLCHSRCFALYPCKVIVPAPTLSAVAPLALTSFS